MFSFCVFPYVDPLSMFAKFVLFYHYNRFVAICGQSINEGHGYRNKYDKRIRQGVRGGYPSQYCYMGKLKSHTQLPKIMLRNVILV